MNYVFQFGSVWRELDLLLLGAWLTIKLSAGAMFFGLLVGIACAQAKKSRWPALRAAVQRYAHDDDEGLRSQRCHLLRL